MGRTDAPGFRMEIKAFGLLTGHPVRRESLWTDIREGVLPEHTGKKNVYGTHLEPEAYDESWYRFADAVGPLVEAGKLGAVVFQWPPWFTAKRANRGILEDVRRRLPDLPVAVEFRHGSWLSDDDRERTLDLLSKLDFTYVVVDEPQGFKNVGAAGGRLHQRARDGPLPRAQPGRIGSARASARPSGSVTCTSREELEEWVTPIRELDAQANQTHALMNNCYRDFGVRNAYDLGRLLGEGIQPGAPEPTFADEES